jgi:hypothetical protein
MAKGEYGFQQRERDHSILYRAASSGGDVEIIWAGKGALAPTATDKRLVRLGTDGAAADAISANKPNTNSQCLYIPEGIAAFVEVSFTIFDGDGTPTYDGTRVGGFFYRAAGGDITLGTGITSVAVDSRTVLLVANVTVQGIEFEVADSAETNVAAVFAKMTVRPIDFTTEGLSRIPDFKTGALSAVESTAY